MKHGHQGHQIVGNEHHRLKNPWGVAVELRRSRLLWALSKETPDVLLKVETHVSHQSEGIGDNVEPLEPHDLLCGFCLFGQNLVLMRGLCDHSVGLEADYELFLTSGVDAELENVSSLESWHKKARDLEVVDEIVEIYEVVVNLNMRELDQIAKALC